MSRVLVDVDNRRRVPLGRLGNRDHTRYVAHDEPDGTIVLEPAVVMTETEARLWRNPELAKVLGKRVPTAPAPDWLIEDMQRGEDEAADASAADR